jgi:FkbM family methyltransferase
MAGQLKYFVRKGLRTARAMLKSGWDRKAFYLHDDYPDEVEMRPDGLFLRPLDLLVPRNTFNFVIDSFPISRTFKDYGKVRFEIEKDKLFVYWNDLKLNPTTAEEIFIIQEIYVSGTYNYQIPHPHIVIDVGMNVAFASLFFASHDKVTKVYSFEPFQPTYQQAQVNIQHNPKFAARIETSPFGLNDKHAVMEVNYTYESKGQVGIHGTDLIRSEIRHQEKAKIELLSAEEALRKIFDRHPQDRFVLKVDCEGAEYGIFEVLQKARLLDQVDIIFIEWHERGPDPLIEILSTSNFKVFYQQASNKKVGMIYGAR